MKRPYAQALTAHEEAYQKLFGRVSLNIGPSSQEETSYRIKHFNERKDLGLVALMFQFGRYLLISSSQPGGQPAGLQGIWNHELLAPWDGKVHHQYQYGDELLAGRSDKSPGNA